MIFNTDMSVLCSDQESVLHSVNQLPHILNDVRLVILKSHYNSTYTHLHVYLYAINTYCEFSYLKLPNDLHKDFPKYRQFITSYEFCLHVYYTVSP